jgi:phosphocarrier protein HPr
MSESALTQTVVVANRVGMHVRVASMIVTLARRFKAKIVLVKGNHRVEATDILELISLGAAQGEQLSLEVSGSEATEALQAMEDLFRRKFDED